MLGPLNTNLGPGPLNTNSEPGLLNTNWRPGPVNTNWGPGLIDANWGRGLGAGAGGQGQGQGPSKGPKAGKYKYPFYTTEYKILNSSICSFQAFTNMKIAVSYEDKPSLALQKLRRRLSFVSLSSFFRNNAFI